MKNGRLFVFLCIVFISLAVPPTRAEAQPEQLSITVVCLEFPDARHSTSIETVKWTAIDRVNQFYLEVSYGQLSVVGEVYGWFMMPAPLSKFDVTRWDSPSEAWYRLVQVALSVAEGNKVRVSGYTFLVFSGPVWGQALPNLRISVQNEKHQWGVYAHELGHILGLPDLYSYEKASKDEPSSIFVGSWDIMSSSSSGQMCVWSRIKLGWIPKTQISTIDLDSRGTIVTISPLEEGKGILAMKIREWYDIRYYLVEVRLGHGVLITNINEGKRGGYGIVTVIDARPSSTTLHDACFDLWEHQPSAYSNTQYNIGIIILSKVRSNYNVLYTTASTAMEAVQVHEAIMAANLSIQRARQETRLEGLEEAKSALQQSVTMYETATFKESLRLAEKARKLADEAVIPKIYYEAKDRLARIGKDLEQIQAKKYEATEAIEKRSEATARLEQAKTAFKSLDFQNTMRLLEESSRLISEAERTEAEFQERKRLEQITTIVAVAVATVTLVAAVTWMRKKRRLSASLSAEQARLQLA